MASLIVDDRDPRFTYSSGWLLGGGVESEFRSTSHGSIVSGSTAVFTFYGTSVILYGTVSPNGPTFSSYSIDNGTAFQYTPPIPLNTIYQQPLYRSSSLKAGEHTLTVTVEKTQTSMFWIDYALIFTDPTLKLNSNAPSSIVDDRDPRFTYSSGWILAGVEAEVDSTTHGSNVSHSTAVLTFHGTSVILYGTVSPDGPAVSSYSVDSGTTFTYTAPVPHKPLQQQPFFGASDLKAGKHTLTVTIVSTEGKGIYWLDYAVIRTDSESNSNVGAIAGWVLGAILFLLVAGLLLWWYPPDSIDADSSKHDGQTIELRLRGT